MRSEKTKSNLLALSVLLMVAALIGALAGCAPRASTGSTEKLPVEQTAVKEIPTQPVPPATVPLATVPPTARPMAPEPAGDPGAEALAYPGATPMELTDLAHEYCLEDLQIGCANPPIRTPDGTRGIFSYTSDTPEQIKAHYDAVFPAAGWTFVRQWLAVNSIVDSWSNGTQRVDMVYMFDFGEANLARLRDQFGMDIPPDHRLIVAWPWEAGETVAPAGDPLAYPGSTALEPSTEGQAYYLGTWPEVFASVPVRIPAGTPATIAYTRDESAQVKAYFGEALPTAGWALARDGGALDAYVSVWHRDLANLVILIDANYTEEALTWYADTFDIHLPDRDVVLISTYTWYTDS